MPNDTKTKEFWKSYKKLPQDLKDAVFAEDTGNSIYKICEKYGILNNLAQVVEQVGRVLLGTLPPDDFRETLEKGLLLDKETAEKISQEVYRSIFYPVKSSLQELYGVEIAPIAKMKITAPPAPTKRKPIVSAKKDTYREAVK